MSIIPATFKPVVHQHKCCKCGKLIMESGRIKDPNTTEVKFWGVWKKGEVWVNYVMDPIEKSKVIAFLYWMFCKNCGSKNSFNVATGGKLRPKLQYDHLKQEQATLYI